MLVDINFDHPIVVAHIADRKQRMKDNGVPLEEYYDIFPQPERLAQGIYHTHLNYNHDIDYMVESEYPFNDPCVSWNKHQELKDDPEALGKWYEAHWAEQETLPNDGGLCDNLEQIIGKWPEIVTMPRNLIIYMTFCDDLRPHKWHPYIGDNPEVGNWEYIKDTPNQDGIWVFHFLGN